MLKNAMERPHSHVLSMDLCHILRSFILAEASLVCVEYVSFHEENNNNLSCLTLGQNNEKKKKKKKEGTRAC